MVLWSVLPGTFKGPRAGHVKDRQLLKFKRASGNQDNRGKEPGKWEQEPFFPAPTTHPSCTVPTAEWRRQDPNARPSPAGAQLRCPASPGEPGSPHGPPLLACPGSPSPCPLQRLPTHPEALLAVALALYQVPSSSLCRMTTQSSTGHSLRLCSLQTLPKQRPNRCPRAGAGVSCSGTGALGQRPQEKACACLNAVCGICTFDHRKKPETSRLWLREGSNAPDQKDP